jgi:dTDP-4-amino-4,6-dideoxygalactose transaminase
MSFNQIRDFESQIADFFGSKFCVATDSCTHAIELCLRYTEVNDASCPKHTYISVPFTFEKLNLKWAWNEEQWKEFYFIKDRIIDAAVYWKPNGYIPNTLMCVSFQYKKHLGLGRGGCILTDHEKEFNNLKLMSHDGRHSESPWSSQNISQMGYHYHMTPETAELGIKKLPEATKKPARVWSWKDYPNLTKMAVFK